LYSATKEQLKVQITR